MATLTETERREPVTPPHDKINPRASKRLFPFRSLFRHKVSHPFEKPRTIPSSQMDDSSGPTVRTAMGFYCELQILVPSDDAIVDVVFIPGRTGENRKTWASDSTYWPTDFLKEDIPPARILAFEYGSKQLDSSPRNAFPTAELPKLALEFAKRCNASLIAGRPLIFITYKFGALMLQAALSKDTTLFSRALGIFLISNPLEPKGNESSTINPISETQSTSFEGYISPRTLSSPDIGETESQSEYQFWRQEILDAFHEAHNAAQSTVGAAIPVLDLPSSPPRHDDAQVRFDSKDAVGYKSILRKFHVWLMKQQEAALKDWGDISVLAWDAYSICNASPDIDVADHAPSIAELANTLHVIEEGARVHGLGSKDLRDLRNSYKKLSEWLDRLLKEPQNNHVYQIAEWNTALDTINDKLHKGVKFNLTEPKSRPDQAKDDGINRDNDIKFNLPLVSYPLSDDDKALTVWKDIEEGVKEVLTTSKIAWLIIDICYRRRPGYDYTKTLVKCKPVVLIIATRTSEQEWGELKKRLQNKIKMIVSSLDASRRDIELGVELLNSRVRLQSPPIGTGLVELHNVCGGTLGGWVHLCPVETKGQTKKIGKPLPGRYILTNHHVVQAADDNNPGPFNDFTIPQTWSTSGESGFISRNTSMLSADDNHKDSFIAQDENGSVPAPIPITVDEDPGMAADGKVWIPSIKENDNVLIDLLSPYQNSQDRNEYNAKERAAITSKYAGQQKTKRMNFTLQAYEGVSNTWDASRYDSSLGAYGKVVASSGWRLRSSGPSAGRFMDWALIRVLDSGRCENQIPDPSPTAKYEMPLKILHDAAHSHPKHMIRLGIADCNRLQLVARVGMRTTSYGILDNREGRALQLSLPATQRQTTSKLTGRHLLTQEEAARMYGWMVYGVGLNFFPHWHPISLPGDSGSWIINSEGDLVALLYAGDGLSLACVTPIEDVIQDIEEQTPYTIRLPGGVDPLLYKDSSLPVAYRG